MGDPESRNDRTVERQNDEMMERRNKTKIPKYGIAERRNGEPRPPLSQVLAGTLNHAACNVYSPKAFETLIHGNVTHIVCFIVSKISFLLVLSKRSIQSKRTCQNVQGLRHW